MELGSDHHPDPFRDAMQDAGVPGRPGRLVRGHRAQVYAYHRRAQSRIAAERDHQARRALNAQIRAEREADRARWEPALDPGWLRRAASRDRRGVGRRAALYRPRRALVRARRRHRHDQMRRTAPPPAPLRHGLLRPAPQRRARAQPRRCRQPPRCSPAIPRPGTLRPCRGPCWNGRSRARRGPRLRRTWRYPHLRAGRRAGEPSV